MHLIRSSLLLTPKIPVSSICLYAGRRVPFYCLTHGAPESHDLLPPAVEKEEVGFLSTKKRRAPGFFELSLAYSFLLSEYLRSQTITVLL